MLTELQPARREPRKSASFHDVAARETYASRFGAIGISAIVAGLHARRTARQTPAVRDIPAILRRGPEAD